jgi:hypothetical protein
MGLFCCAAVALGVGYHPREPEYVYVPDTAREVGFHRQRVLFIGTLDADGNFYVERQYDDDQPGSRKIGRLTWIGKWGPAYELRAGKLVKGEIDGAGVFVPDPWAPVIRFQDYRFSPDAIPIWNLPGYFKKIDKK